MINILFYGNCQLFACLKTLRLSNKEFNVKHIECWKHIDKLYFTNEIRKCDIIITQPIVDNYRDVDYLSTTYIIKNKKHKCKLIIFNSCYFNFYYFDSTYKQFNNAILHKPIDYHYNKMIECYNANKSIEYYITHFANNIDLKTSDELEKLAQDSIIELQNRYTTTEQKYTGEYVYIIKTHEYIRQNYKDLLLFYSMNHPTKWLIQFICKAILNILQIPDNMNYKIDLLRAPKCILYKCISKNVNFDINANNTLDDGNTKLMNTTQLYYDTYKQLGINPV